MLPSERKQQILAILKQHREVSVQAIADVLEEAPANIRRDLRELEKESRILRRHGRVLYRSTMLPSLPEPEGDLDPTLLDELVDETARLLDEARNLFLSGGSVLVRVARKLGGKTIATHDLSIAMAAAQGDNDVTLVGRELENKTLTLRSPNPEAELAELGFDAVVVETDGIDEKNLWVARQTQALLPALLERTQIMVAVARSSALGKKGDRVAGPLNRADVLVIDRGASTESIKALTDQSVEVRVAGSTADGAYGFSQVGNVFQFKRSGGAGGAGRASALAAVEHLAPESADDN